MFVCFFQWFFKGSLDNSGFLPSQNGFKDLVGTLSNWEIFVVGFYIEHLRTAEEPLRVYE